MKNFRFDRLASLYLFGPYSRMRRTTHCELPILMYHSVAEEDERNVAPYYRIATHPRVFAEHMHILHESGYKTVDVGEALRILSSNPPQAAKTVVITFDDGYRNFYTHAFPVLSRFGYTATMYLPTEYIGSATKRFKDRDCLNWSEVRELHNHGMAFGSHTVTHPKLYGLSWDAIDSELSVSRQTIEQELGAKTTSFAYPYAFPETDQDFRSTLRRRLLHWGYENNVCTTIGRCDANSDAFFLNRLPVNSCDDRELFLAKLGGGYDWLAAPQSLLKRAKKAGIYAEQGK